MVFGNRCQASQRRGAHAIGMKRQSIRNILVPIDFSKLSMHAIKTAKWLAQRFAASIHLAHVRQFDYAAGFSAPAPPMVPFSFTMYEQEGEKRVVNELNALAREYGISSASCRVLGGGPAFDEICRIAQEIPADLIVMPTHGRTGLKHVFLGSTAERIVQHSPSPVLVTRGSALQSKDGSRFRINRILVPVDFSGCSREGLQYAVGFASEFGAKIILVHATYLGYIYSSEGTALYDIPALQEAARKNAERRMRTLVRTAKFGRSKFETVFTDGSPVSDICDLAKNRDVDLIVTSTHGLTGLQHVLIGSVAEQIVRRAPCAVLVVPSHPKIRMANLAETHGRVVQKTVRERGKRTQQRSHAVAR
jgi:nucleotide-binding universal stress UspA family protein